MTIGDDLLAAMGSHRGSEAADRLCRACVELLDADAAAISLVHEGANIATLGASDPHARTYDELQFTLGEGPCLDAVAQEAPILVDDLAGPIGQNRWPAYGESLLAHRIRSVCAVPIVVAGQSLGALEVFYRQPAEWTLDHIVGLAEAAEIAQIPVLDLLGDDMAAAATTPGSDAWNDLNSLTRAEVSQATGMLMAQLNLTAATALARLRAHAFATGCSATSVARDILEHRLHMEPD